MNIIYKQLSLDPNSPFPLAAQLSHQLRMMIVDGRVSDGDLLPNIRELAAHLAINMHTVRAAYQQLAAEGLVSIRAGRGTVVQPLDLVQLTRHWSAARTYTTGIIIAGFNAFYGMFMRGVEAAAVDDPSLYLICDAKDSNELARRYFEQLVARHVDGIIVVSLRVESAGGVVPLVHADMPDAEGPSAYLDLEEGSERAVRHMIDQHGHRQIALIAPPREWPNVGQVYRGYERALQSGGLDVRSDFMVTVPDFKTASGYEALEKILSLSPLPTALLAGDDNLALGILRAAKELGLRVPNDLAVIGINDLEFAAVVDPPLTTLMLPAHELGFRAMTMLRQLRQGDLREAPETILPTQLILRQSCGCHPT